MALAVPSDVRALVETSRLQTSTLRPTVVRTALIVAAYGIGTALGFAAGQPLVWVGVWCVQAVILNGALSASHEGVHGNLAARPAVNRAFAEFWSTAVLLNFSLYRAYHLEHHRRTRLEGDPEPQTEFKALWQYLLALPFIGVGTVVQMLVTSMASLVGRFPGYVRTARQRRAIRTDAVWILAVTAATVTWAVASPRTFLLAWGLPILVSSPVFSLTVLPEHYGLPHVPDPLEATRSTRSNRLFSYFYWENNLHASHHLLPGVPYHRQEALSEALGDRVVNRSPSYVQWHLGLVRDLRRARVGNVRDQPAVIDLRDSAATDEGRGTSTVPAAKPERHYVE